MRDRLGTVTGIVRGAVQDAARGLRMVGWASVAIFRKLAPTSVQHVRGSDDSADIPPNTKAARGRTVTVPAAVRSPAAQVTGAAAPPAAAVPDSTAIAADQEVPEVLSPTAPMTEPGANNTVAAKKAAPAKKLKKTKATDQKAATGSRGAVKKAAPVKQEPAKKVASAKVPAKKTAPANRVTAKKAAPPKISPAETAAPTTVPQPPAGVDVDADTGASGVSATRAVDLAP